MFEENMYNNQPSVRITSFSLALINQIHIHSLLNECPRHMTMLT